ncbi:Txe/YoeB family addiction module toxin [Albibacterium bauzanense]|uniref:Txe/YoeB family addiction module toxin n=1 Tax=Albibacterium bauzanense TaxID=653929 RepID=UPI001C8859D5|nr:Txe/YoeB family addiction module toxin [Albibacterium bauzanense]
MERVFAELVETPFIGIGEPEMLKYQYAGYWSRKVNQKDRLIYMVHEDTVTVYIVSAKGHYNDR